ncbi:T2 family ribonuclease [Piscirickettsia salmonis]|uniref:T2 family ribonuclease n=1 Tax=Piscirickettsia salmonis TaxID=1238 RepID=UPI0007C8FE40|nr:Ribonuclease I precursor [Piscirickettsiaceae bacterium NZ-RLO1]
MLFRKKMILKSIIISATLLNSLSSIPNFAKSSNPESGDFDHYVFAQTWLPQFCESKTDNSSCKNKTSTSLELTIHGLWPNYAASGSWPASCVNSPGCDDPTSSCGVDYNKLKPIQDSLDQYMPGGEDFLWNHEWQKHGTCSGLDQEPYFTAALNLETKLPTLQDVSSPTSLEKLQQVFNNKATFYCSKDKETGKVYLKEVHTYWSYSANDQDKYIPDQQLSIPSGENSNTCVAQDGIILRSFSSNWS